MGVGTFGTDGELFYEIDLVPAKGQLVLHTPLQAPWLDKHHDYHRLLADRQMWQHHQVSRIGFEHDWRLASEVFSHGKKLCITLAS